MLADTPLRLPVERPGAQSAWHLFIVRHPQRDALKAHLEANGVGCAIHYPLPLHLQKCYAELGHGPGDFPVAERACGEVLALPFFPAMTDAQQDRAVAVIREFFGR